MYGYPSDWRAASSASSPLMVLPESATVSRNAFLTSGSGTLSNSRRSARRRNVVTSLSSKSLTIYGKPANTMATPFLSSSGVSLSSASVMTCCTAVAMATKSSCEAACVSSMVMRMPFPLPSFLLPSRLFNALRNVSGLDSAEKCACPRLAVAMPEIPMEGLILA